MTKPWKRTRGNASVAVIVGLIVALVVVGVLAWRSAGPVRASGAGPRATAAESVEASIEAGRHYLSRGEVEKAETVLRQAAAEHPEDQEVRVVFAETLTARQKRAEAYEQYEKALAIGPATPELHFSAGTTANTAGRPDRAIEHYSMAQALDKVNATYPLYLALVQIKLEQLDEAKKNLLIAVNLDPDQAVAWGSLADLWLRENAVDLCLQHVAKARELQPKVTEWRLIEARARKRKGDAEGALQLLVVLDPSERRQEHILRLTAECYGLLSRPTDAAAAYVDAANADRTNAVLAYEAACWYDRAGDATNATAWAGRAKMLGSADAAALVEKLAGR